MLDNLAGSVASNISLILVLGFALIVLANSMGVGGDEGAGAGDAGAESGDNGSIDAGGEAGEGAEGSADPGEQDDNADEGEAGAGEGAEGGESASAVDPNLCYAAELAGWTPEEISEHIKSAGPQRAARDFTRLMDRVLDDQSGGDGFGGQADDGQGAQQQGAATNAPRQGAEAGGAQQPKALALPTPFTEQEIKELADAGADPWLLDKLVKPFNAKIEAVTKWLDENVGKKMPGLERGLAATQRREQHEYDKSVNTLIDGVAGKGFQSVYGTAERASRAQLAMRHQLHDMALSILQGARKNNRSVTPEKAMQLAHFRLNSPQGQKSDALRHVESGIVRRQGQMRVPPRMPGTAGGNRTGKETPEQVRTRKIGAIADFQKGR